MGMFDYYQPQPTLACPVCGTPLAEWQGKDGPCGFFVWRQGAAAPIVHDVPDETRLEPLKLATVRLPASFTIYASCCSPRFSVEARCEAPAGVWTSAELVTAANATQHRGEARAVFSARLKWLANTTFNTSQERTIEDEVPS
jgi:hypothetical protein